MHTQSFQMTRLRSRLAILGCLAFYLMCTGCGVSGPDDPATIQSLKDLGVLVVPNTDGQVNGLNALPTDPAKLTEAIELSSTLKILKTVSAMSGVPLTDDHLATIGKNGSLVELFVEGAQISDAGVAHLTGCSKLESLALVKTPITEASMPLFAKMPKINMLNMNDTKINGGFANLQSCKELQWILIGGLTISDEEADAISKIPGITHITLSDTTQISDAGMKSLKSVKDCNVDLVKNVPDVTLPTE